MSILMKPVPEDKLENLRGIFDRRFEEMRDERHLSSNTLLDVLKTAYSNRTMDCYVDDVANPSTFVIFTRLYSLWDNDPQLLVNAVYTDVSARGDTEKNAAVIRLVEGYAGVHGLENISCWSPINADGTPKTKLWELAGYTPTGITYSKKL